MKDASTLARLLSDDFTSGNTFEGIAVAFHHYFNASEFLHVGKLIAMMVENNDILPTVHQRASGLYLLFVMYKGDQLTSNPHCVVFSRFLNDENTVKSPEKRALAAFVSHLLHVNPGAEMFKRTPRQVLQEFVRIEPADASHFNTVLAARESIAPVYTKSCVPAFVQPPTQTFLSTPNAELIDVLESLSPHVGSTVKPLMVRVPPPQLVAEDELVWMNPLDADHKMIFDDSLSPDEQHSHSDPNSTQLKSLLEISMKQAVTMQQQNQLQNEISTCKDLSALYVKNLPDLVENNPIVAVDLLLKLMESSGVADQHKVQEYLKELVNMEMSVHSMEVVNRLTNEVELPQEFMHLYISNCIQTVESIKDKFHQNRLVRLLCVFLQSLIRNKVVNVSDIMVEVQAFCIDFSSLREAAALFRLMKTLEGGGEADNTPVKSNDGAKS